MAKLQLTDGPIAKMHVTTVISSSKYPKIIYGMPLFEKLVKIRFEFEFKFKFEIKQKRKRNKKKKTEGLGHMGQSRALGPNSSSTAQRTEPTSQLGENRKKEKGRGLADQAHATSPLHGPALRPASLFSESTALA